TAELPSDPGLQDRFWYWHGASGRKYIHSVYEPENCPPLPGAIYVAVRREGHLRIALSVGRFTPFWDGTMMSSEAAHVARRGVDEIHVHLLAKSTVMAEDILADLRDAMEPEDGEGLDYSFHEDEVSPSVFRPSPTGVSAAAA
ncbi:MAG: hypothetical protein GYA66_04140, partial [Phyllobacteriaceae bacterium]|nr:hypothetical protein [Phyllobacteriaceae bacterium]